MKPVLLFILFFITFTSSGQSIEDYINRGNSAKQQNNFRLALDNYLKAYTIQPQNASLIQAIAVMYFYLQKFDSSEFFYSELLSKQPDDTIFNYQRGLCYFYTEQFQKSLDDLNKCVRLSKKKNPDITYNIGRCYEGIGDWSDAISNFNQTLFIRKTDKDAFYQLGYCYTVTFDKQNAMLSYNKAINIDPDYWDAYINRGLLFESQFNNVARAHQDFEKGIDLKPNNKLSYLYEGMLFNAEHKFTQAKTIFDKVLTMFPDFAEGYFERAIALQALKDNNDACDDLNAAEKLGYKKATDMKKLMCK